MSDSFSGILPSIVPQGHSAPNADILQQFPIQDVVLRSLTKELAAIKQLIQLEALIKETRLINNLPNGSEQHPNTKTEIAQKPVLDTAPKTPVAVSGKNSTYQIILSTALGDIKLETPSKTPLEAGQRFFLEFKPSIPPSLSRLVLVHDMTLRLNTTPIEQLKALTLQTPKNIPTSGITPIVQPNTTPLTGARPIELGGIVEAFLIPQIKNTNQNAVQNQTSAFLQQLQKDGFIFKGNTPLTNLATGFDKTNLPSQFLSGTTDKLLLKIVHFESFSQNSTQGNDKPQTSGFIPSRLPAAQTGGQAGGQIQLSGFDINLQKPNNLASPLMMGTVVGKTAQNAPILMTDIGQLLVLSNTNLKEGTKIAFQLMAPETSSPAFKQQNFLLHKPPAFIFDKWNSMDEMLSFFTADKASFPQLQNILPSSTKQLPTLLLFFLSALKTGDTSPASLWMGQMLEKSLRDAGKQDLLNRLNADFKSVTRAFKEQKSGLEFKSTLVPFYQDEQIQPIQVLVRHTQSQNEPEKKKDGEENNIIKSVRFIINLHLSRLGKTQLDGYIKNKNMNIILRIENKLPQESMRTLINRYEEVIQTLGLKGSLSFQDNTEWIYFDIMESEEGDIEMRV